MRSFHLKGVKKARFWAVLLFFVLVAPEAVAQSNDSSPVKTSSADSTKRAPSSDGVDDMISFAKKLLGTPYKMGGVTPTGFDCSGFINYVMGNFGFTSLSRTSYGLAELGRTVKLSDLQPGDLMFFKGSSVNSSRVGHVGMVVEVSEDKLLFIHSSTTRGVIIDNFKTSKYFIPRYVTSKRLDYNGYK